MDGHNINLSVMENCLNIMVEFWKSYIAVSDLIGVLKLICIDSSKRE